MAYPRSLLNDGEHIVVSTRSHPQALLLSDIPRVGQVQLQVAEELHELSSGDRSDDGT